MRGGRVGGSRFSRSARWAPLGPSAERKRVFDPGFYGPHECVPFRGLAVDAGVRGCAEVRASYIPPFAYVAKDGAPELFRLVKGGPPALYTQFIVGITAVRIHEHQATSLTCTLQHISALSSVAESAQVEPERVGR